MEMGKKPSKHQLTSFTYKLYKLSSSLDERSIAALVERYGQSDKKGMVLTGSGKVKAYDLLDARIQSAFFMGDPISGLLVVTPSKG